VIFNDRLSEVAENYLRKGSKVYLEGSLQTRKWTDKDGAEKWTTEVVLQKYRGELVMLDSKSDDTDDSEDTTSSYGAASYGARQAHQGGAVRGKGAPDLDDDIPF
jgi:single-strand DNA-binding protein